MRKRVLMVSIEGLGNGGVQSVMMGIVRYLSPEFYFDMLLFTSEVRHYDVEFLGYGGKIFRVPHYEGSSSFKQRFDRYIRDVYVYKSVNRILDLEQQYDIIHCNKQFESAPILLAAARHNIPVRICHTHVITFQAGFVESMINNIRKKIINKYSSHLIGCSEEACRSFYLKQSKYCVIPNFYNDVKYKFCELTQSNPIILTQVGSFSDVKNQLFSVEVFQELINGGFDARLRLIGIVIQEEYKNNVYKTIESYGLENMIQNYQYLIFQTV